MRMIGALLVAVVMCGALVLYAKGAAVQSTPKQCAVEKRSKGRCITPGAITTRDDFRHWEFTSSCNEKRTVAVCARFTEKGWVQRLATTVPPKGAAEINLGMESEGPVQVNCMESEMQYGMDPCQK